MIRFKDTYSAQGRMLLLGRKFEATIWYSFQYGELDITEIELIGLYENGDKDYHSFNLSIKLDFCELTEEQQTQAEELVEFHYNKKEQEDYE